MKDSILGYVSVALVGSLIGRLLRYFLNIEIARELGAPALGTFAFGLVVMKAASTLAQLGLGTAAQRYIPKFEAEGNERAIGGVVVLCFAVPLSLGVVLSGAISAFTGEIARFAGETFGTAARTLVFGIPLFAAMMAGVGATKGFRETKYAVYVRDIGQSGIAVVGVGIAVLLVGTLESAVVAYLCSLGVGVLLAAASNAKLAGWRSIVRPELRVREVLTFALPLLGVSVVQYVISWTDIAVLGLVVPSEQVGYYQAAFQTSVLMLLVLQAANAIFPSVASDLYERGNETELQRVFSGVTKWVFVFTSLGYVSVFAYGIVVLELFGSAFGAARVALLVLATGQLVAAVTGPVGYLLSMSGYERLEFLNTLGVAVLNLIANVLLIRTFGVLGAAAATALSLSILNIIRLVEVRLLLGVHPFDRSYWKGIVAAAGGGVVVVTVAILFQRTLLFAILAGVLGLAAIVGVTLLVGLDEADRQLLESL